jgi:hypothetical protein
MTERLDELQAEVFTDEVGFQEIILVQLHLHLLTKVTVHLIHQLLQINLFFLFNLQIMLEVSTNLSMEE